MPARKTRTVPFMAIADDDFEIIILPSDDKTRVRIRYYSPDQLRFLLANPEEHSVRVLASNGGAFVVVATTTAPAPKAVPIQGPD